MNIERAMEKLSAQIEMVDGRPGPEMLRGRPYYRHTWAAPAELKPDEHLVQEFYSHISRDVGLHQSLSGPGEEWVLVWRKRPFWSVVGGEEDRVLDCSYRIAPRDLMMSIAAHCEKPSSARLLRDEITNELRELALAGVQMSTTDPLLAQHCFVPLTQEGADPEDEPDRRICGEPPRRAPAMTGDE